MSAVKTSGPRARPVEEYLNDAIEDARFALDLLKSDKPEDKAMLDEKLDDITRALVNAANGLKRRRVA